MSDASGNILHRYPGDVITIAGAKKKIPASFSRPWQSQVPYPNPKCPFHRPEWREKALLTATGPEDKQWFVLDSEFAPEKPHHLIVPDNCWDDEPMRKLGGLLKIGMAIELAAEQFAHESNDDQRGLWGLSVQVGPLAAQNVPHCHYHLYRPNLFDDVARIEFPSKTCITRNDILLNREVMVLSEICGFEVIAGGYFTGQLFIFPIAEMPFDPHSALRISYLVNNIVGLYGEKFRSVEGLAPDFRWEFEIHDGKINFGIFVPKLNNNGTLEDMAMIDHRRAVNLLWSHEETARYLRGE